MPEHFSFRGYLEEKAVGEAGGEKDLIVESDGAVKVSSDISIAFGIGGYGIQKFFAGPVDEHCPVNLLGTEEKRKEENKG